MCREVAAFGGQDAKLRVSVEQIVGQRRAAPVDAEQKDGPLRESQAEPPCLLIQRSRADTLCFRPDRVLPDRLRRAHLRAGTGPQLPCGKQAIQGFFPFEYLMERSRSRPLWHLPFPLSRNSICRPKAYRRTLEITDRNAWCHRDGRRDFAWVPVAARSSVSCVRSSASSRSPVRRNATAHTALR